MTFLDWLKQKKMPRKSPSMGRLQLLLLCSRSPWPDAIDNYRQNSARGKKIRNSDQNDYPITQCKQQKRMKTQLAQLDTVSNKSQSKPMWWSTSSVFQIESYICIHLPTAFKTRFAFHHLTIPTSCVFPNESRNKRKFVSSWGFPISPVQQLTPRTDLTCPTEWFSIGFVTRRVIIPCHSWGVAALNMLIQWYIEDHL